MKKKTTQQLKRLAYPTILPFLKSYLLHLPVSAEVAAVALAETLTVLVVLKQMQTVLHI